MPILIANNLTYEDAQRFTFQIKNLRMAGLNWIFYSDGTNFGYKTSLDNYGSFTALWAIAYGNYVSLWFDGVKLHYIRRVGYSQFAYRRGTPNSDATITWDFDEVIVSPSLLNPGAVILNCATSPFIASDNSGNIWMCVDWTEMLDTTIYYYMRVYYAPASNPTSPSEKTDLRLTGRWFGGIIPLTGTKLAYVWGYSSQVVYVRFSGDGGSTWGSTIATTSTVYALDRGSFTAYGDNLYVAVQRTDTDDLWFLKIAYGETSWTETLISSYVYEGYAGISVEATGKIRIFFTTYISTIMYVHISTDGGATWTWETFLTGLTTYVRWINTARGDLDNIILVTWKERTVSPYYLYLEVVSTIAIPPVVKRPLMKIDAGPHPRSRLIFAPTLILKGVGIPPPPPPAPTWDDFMEEWF